MTWFLRPDYLIRNWIQINFKELYLYFYLFQLVAWIVIAILFQLEIIFQIFRYTENLSNTKFPVHSISIFHIPLMHYVFRIVWRWPQFKP